MIPTGPQRRIAVVDPFLPLHDRNSGSLRLFHLVEMLVEDGHDVTFIANELRAGHERYAADLEQVGARVVAPRSPGRLEESSVRAAIVGGAFDLAIVTYVSYAPFTEPYVARFRSLSPTTEVVIDTVDLHFVRERRHAELLGDPAAKAAAERTYVAELGAYRDADRLIAITDVERAVLHAELPGARVVTIPNVHELPEQTGLPFAQRDGLLFVGNFWHTPNAEAVVWFCTEVLPLVRRRVPSVRVQVVGQDPPPGLALVAGPEVQLLGWVPDLAPHLEAAKVSIAPLLHGAGMKGKVGEALAAGLPVVTTSIGAEGMGLVDGQSARIADDPADFADAVVEVLSDPDAWSRLQSGGRAVVRDSYTPEAVRGAVRALVAPTTRAPLRYFLAIDWAEPATAIAEIDRYVRAHHDSPRATLFLGIGDTAPDDAFGTVATWLVDLGHDPSAVPDISLLPGTTGSTELPRDVAVLGQRELVRN